MIQIRQAGARSWLNPDQSWRMAAALGHKLWDRCKGRKGVFVTLTYRREPWKNDRDLYRCQRDEQHVPLFLRKLERRLDTSFKGRWLCKMEFQQDGFVHWHLVILDIDFIAHDVLAACWGHGHAWISRLTKRRVKYTLKYAAKDGGDVPRWLFGERMRSVKIVRVSPGFWGDQSDEDSHDGGEEEDEAAHDCSGPPAAVLHCAYQPIGQIIEDRRHEWTARDPETGKFMHADVPYALVLYELAQLGCTCIARDGSWLVIDASMRDLQRAVQAARLRGEAAKPALHSIQRGNPDVVSHDDLPGWLRHWIEGEEVAA